LCGGIRRCDFFLVANIGINVYAGLTGEADHILNSFLAGNITAVEIDEKHAFQIGGWSGRRRNQTGPHRWGRGKSKEPGR
jgi:hypothetical protein